jgi:hypothetical protein
MRTRLSPLARESVNKPKPERATMSTTTLGNVGDDGGDDNNFIMMNTRSGAAALRCSSPTSSILVVASLDHDDALSSSTSWAPPVHIPPSMTGPFIVVSTTGIEVSPETMNKKSKKNQNPTTTKSEKKKRHVSFQESQNQVYANPHHHDVYKEDLKQLCWYNGHDYAAFKQSAEQCASSSYYSSSSLYPQTLRHVYEACVRCPSEDEADSILTMSEDFVHLKDCLAKAPSRWGVERAAVRWIAADRHYRKSAMLELVLEMHQTMSGLFAANGSGSSSSSSSSGSSSMFMDDDGLDEVLRLSCEALSRPSRLFARHLAQAAAE